jgi:GTP-binding protein
VLLFCIPCDTNNIREEYETLLNELRLYNPELLDKPRLLALTKSDLIDDELKEMLKVDIPEGIDHLYISAVAQKGLDRLKDELWRKITEE